MFLDNLWAFPSGSYTSLFKLTGASCRCFLKSGRVQWETNKLVDLQGGTLSISQDFNFGAGKFFGLGANPMTTAGSTGGLILNGAPGHDTYPNDVGGKVFASHRHIDFSPIRSSAPNTSMSDIQAYDGATRVWEFYVRTTALNGTGASNSLRLFVNPGWALRIDLNFPNEIGEGSFRLTYRPDLSGGSAGSMTATGWYIVTATGVASHYYLNTAEPANHWKVPRFLEAFSLGDPNHATIDVMDFYEYTL